jgi:hypothetical protein
MSATVNLKRAASAALISCALVAAALPVSAENQTEPLRPFTSPAKTYAGKGATQFDWLKSPKAATDTRVVLASGPRAPGSGSWICSPAGFGTKSTCRMR